MKTLDQIYAHIKTGLKSAKSYRTIGRELGVQPSMVRLLEHGYQPGNKVRRQLGLPPASEVVSVSGADIPSGTQVIGSRQCACGQWFVPNSPRRQRCYLCSPYKKSLH